MVRMKRDNLEEVSSGDILMWTDEYIGLKFQIDGRSREGVDCWGLVCVIYKEKLGIELPLIQGVFVDTTISCLVKVAKAMGEERLKWHKVDKPQLYDVVMLRTGEYSWHVGLFIGKHQMIHVMSGIDSAIEDLNGVQWKNRIEGYYRYVC